METTTAVTGAAGASAPTPKAPVAALGVATTVISISFVAMTGWMNASTPLDRIAWSVFAVVVILGAHVVPALVRRSSLGVRAFAAVLWAACMVYSLVSHATYFLVAQQDAGMRRAATGGVEFQQPPTRTLSAVLAEHEYARSELAKLASSSCHDCRRVRVRQVELRAKLEVLQAEADESRRSLRDYDESRALQKSRRADPVATRVSAVLGISQELASLIPALVFAFVLDGLGVLFWLLAAESAGDTGAERDAAVPVVVTATDPASVATDSATAVASSRVGAFVTRVATNDSPATTTAPRVPCESRISHTVASGLIAVRAALESGDLDKATVAAIQKFLGCAQGTALAVARAIRDGAPRS